MSHEKTLKAFVSLLSVEKGYPSTSSKSFCNQEKPVVKVANTSWALNGFLKSFSFGGNVQCFLPSLSVITPGDEAKIHGDDQKHLVNTIIKALKPGCVAAKNVHVPFGYTNEEMLQNFSRRLVFSSGDRNFPSESTSSHDILSTLIRKQLSAKKIITKPVAELLALQVKNKAPTELDDQTLIAPFVDLWDSPCKTFPNQHLQNTHISTDLPCAKRKHLEKDKEEEERSVNDDNDFPFDMNERVRRISARISSCSMTFEVPKEYLPMDNANTLSSVNTASTTSSGSSRISSISLPLSLTTKTTLDISIMHALRANLVVSTTGYIQGKFRDDLLEEIEVSLDTKSLLADLTDQVKLSIKKGIALLISVKATEPKPPLIASHAKGKSTQSGEAEEKSKGGVRSELKSAVYSNTYDKRPLSTSFVNRPTAQSTQDYTRRQNLSNTIEYMHHSNLYPDFNGLPVIPPNTIEQVRNRQTYPDAQIRGYGYGYIPQSMGPAQQPPYRNYGYRDISLGTPFSNQVNTGITYHNDPHIHPRFGDPRSYGSTVFERDMHMMTNTVDRIDPTYTIFNSSDCTRRTYADGSFRRPSRSDNMEIQMANYANRIDSADTTLNPSDYSTWAGAVPYRRSSRSDMIDIPIRNNFHHGMDSFYNMPKSSDFARLTEANVAFRRPSQSNMIEMQMAKYADRLGSMYPPSKSSDFTIRADMGGEFRRTSQVDTIPIGNFAIPGPMRRRNSIIEPAAITAESSWLREMNEKRLEPETVVSFEASKTNGYVKSSMPLDNQEQSIQRQHGDALRPIISQDATARNLDSEQQARIEYEPKPEVITSSEINSCSELLELRKRNSGNTHITNQDKSITNDNGTFPRRRSSFPIESILAAVNLARISEPDEADGDRYSNTSTPLEFNRRRSSTAAYTALIRFLEEEEKSKGGDSEISIDTINEFGRFIELEDMLRRSSAPGMISAAETVRRWEIDHGLERRESEISLNAAAEAARFQYSAERARRGSNKI